MTTITQALLAKNEFTNRRLHDVGSKTQNDYMSDNIKKPNTPENIKKSREEFSTALKVLNAQIADVLKNIENVRKEDIQTTIKSFAEKTSSKDNNEELSM